MSVENDDIIREILETEIQTKFPARQPGVPMAFANTRYTTPTTPWIYVTVIPNVDKRANLNSLEFEALGIVNVTCMVPENSGTKQVRQMAGAIKTIMLDRQIAIPAGGHITVYGSSARERGVINGWYTVNVILSYRARVRIVR